MKLLKKASAVLMTSVLVLSSAQVSLTASALSVEDAVQAAIRIANDNSHGYDFNNRWGPDYDCSSFVLTSLKQGGFDIGEAIGTQTMKRGLTKVGWKWYPWSEIHSMDDLKRGDILLNEALHTEFYIGRGQNCGAHWNCGNPETGDQSGHEIDVCGYYDNPWDGVLRYTNDIPRVKPTDVEISTYTKDCAVNQNVHFEFFSINSAKQYLDIYKDSKRVQHINVTNKYQYDMKFTEGGTYTYKLFAKNVVGEVTTAAQTIRVFKNKPSNVTVGTDKKVYAKGETVIYTFGAKDATYMSLYTGMGTSVDVLGKTSYKQKATEAGYYYYSLSTSNPVGYTEAYGQSFEVYDKKPENVYLNADKSELPVLDAVTFNFGSSHAAEQYIVINKDGKEFDKINVTGKNTQSVTIEKNGAYSCYLLAKNKFGETKSSKVSFSAYSSGPINVEGYMYENTYKPGSKISISLSADRADERSVLLYEPSGKVTKLVADDDGYVKTTIKNEGEYYYSAGASNRFGETYTDKKKIVVSKNAPTILHLTTDKQVYKKNEQVHVYFDVKNAISTSLYISDPEYTDRDSIDVTGLSEYAFMADKDGSYSVILSASNGNDYVSNYVNFEAGNKYTIRYQSYYNYFYESQSEFKRDEDAVIETTLPDEVPEDSEIVLAGWSTIDSAKTAQYRQGDAYTDRKSVTLYPVWTSKDKAELAGTFKNFEWDDEYSSAYAVFEITDGDETTEEKLPAVVTSEFTETNCAGQNKIAIKAAVSYQGETYTDTKTDNVGKKGHDYTLRSWKWDGTNSAAATFICENDPSHKKTVKANIEKTTSKDGKTLIYTASASVGGSTFVSTKTAAAGILGDLDDDKTITSADALAALRISVGLEKSTSKIISIADIDGDGTITSGDALDILRSSVGLTSNEKIGKPIG